jgi:uridine phosphorylase
VPTPALELGDLAITTGAVRDDGTSRSYVAPEYPAVASHELVGALVDAARAAGARHRTGITWSLDAFYARNAVAGPNDSMTSMSFEGYWPSHLETRIRDMQAARVLNCEMEAGITLTLAGLFDLRAGCICVVSDRTPWSGPTELDLDRNMAQCIEVATQAMLSLGTRGRA